MARYTLSYFLLLAVFGAFAQNYDDLNPPNTFRNPDNPFYWKNRKPHEGYWQQDVHYSIDALISEKTDIISGSENLVYWNNSPDELTFVYFHLYQNAFQPCSYYDDLHRNNDIVPVFGKYETQKLGTEILSLKVNGQEVKTELDNTILKVYLPQVLKSGESVTFDIGFKTYFDTGSMRRRMKTFNEYGFKHYDGVHWYPRISVYDKKFGWTTDQHLGHEFYGDYGTFDVSLTFASNFVVEATGNLINKDEVLPKELREKLDISNFKNKPLSEPPSVIIPYDSTKTKTWKFHAENVHDFAFTADPTYRIGEVEWNGVKCISVCQEPHASKWQNAAQYTAEIIRVYSEDFGMYAYPKMVVADARDGMEYPMLTLDGGFDPDYRGLLAHEVGHNWFFGMVGNNETYRAFMDEGFTQFLTSWALRRIDGEYNIQPIYKSGYVNKFSEPSLVTDKSVYIGYMSDAVKEDDAFLNTHSDGFGGAIRHGGGYRHAYYKTATMLYNLQYVLGDTLFSDAMKFYFNKWKIAHPYPEDFRNTIIQYTKADLNWFFDQWLETTKVIDYSVADIKKGENKNEYIITFKRKGRMQMPLDFEVESHTDSVYKYYIPNTWFEKKTEAAILPRWIGWDNLKPAYEAKVIIPDGIKSVTIDPSNRLADIYMLDNSNKTPHTISFDHRIYNMPSWKNYELFARPDLWYNGYDGAKPGLHINGHYMHYRHIFDANFWINTGMGQSYPQSPFENNNYDTYSFRLNYKTGIHKFLKKGHFLFSAKSLDGLKSVSSGLEKWDTKDKNKIYVYFKSMYRADTSDLNYLLYPEQWNHGKFNNTINLGIDHKYQYQKGNGLINLNLKSSTFGSDYDYSYLSLTAVNKNKIKKIEINTRFFAQVGTGLNVAKESALYLAGNNPEGLMDNKFTRSTGFFDDSWFNYGNATNHFHQGGGLNLRGYAGYVAPTTDNEGNVVYTFSGTSGSSLSCELEFDELLTLMPKSLRKAFKIDTYLFADAGLINLNSPEEKLMLDDIRVDAGIGAAFSIKRWGPLQMVNPLVVRFDMPLFLNRTPAISPEFIQYRYVIGINRAF